MDQSQWTLQKLVKTHQKIKRWSSIRSLQKWCGEGIQELTRHPLPESESILHDETHRAQTKKMACHRGLEIEDGAMELLWRRQSHIKVAGRHIQASQRKDDQH